MQDQAVRDELLRSLGGGGGRVVGGCCRGGCCVGVLCGGVVGGGVLWGEGCCGGVVGGGVLWGEGCCGGVVGGGVLWGEGCCGGVVGGGVLWGEGCCGGVVGGWEAGAGEKLEFLKGLLVGRLFGKGLVERKNSKKGVGGEEEFEEKDKISGEDKI